MTLPTYPTYPTTPSPPLATTPPPPFSAGAYQVSVGRLVSRSLSVWWSHLFKFGALTLLVIVPVLAAAAAVAYMSFVAARSGSASASLTFRGPRLVMLAGFPVMLAVMVVQMGALTYGAVQHLAGRPVRFGPMIAAGLRRAIPLVGVGIVAGAMVMGGFLLLVVPGIIVGCAVGVAVPAVVAEKIGPVAAIRRSWGLTRGHRFTFFAASFVLGLVATGANMAMQLGVALFGRLAPAVALVGGVLYLLLAALPMLLPAVAYHELRVAKEGVATEELVKVFE
jgi:hypothetical protein